MAGLAAASSLSEAGFDVVLCEAADYLGKERFLIFFISELLRPTLPYIIIIIITVSDTVTITVVIIIIEVYQEEQRDK